MNDNKMTFTVSSDAGTYGGMLNMQIAIDQDSTLDQVLEVFERMALALTYTPGGLKRAYENRLEEMTEMLEAAQKFAKSDEDDDALFSNEGFAAPHRDAAARLGYTTTSSAIAYLRGYDDTKAEIDALQARVRELESTVLDEHSRLAQEEAKPAPSGTSEDYTAQRGITEPYEDYAEWRARTKGRYSPTGK